MGTSLNRASSIDQLHKRGEGFNIPGVKINGMNVLEVIEEGKKAIDYVRSGKGPILVEMDTYRYRGHSMSDPATYRSKDEVNNKKQNQDPISSFKSYILDNKIAKEDEIKTIDKKIKSQIEEIVKFAKESPEPDENEIFDNIYQ
jgi:pyruvate dehydrogenase E1 component alpha subunit